MITDDEWRLTRFPEAGEGQMMHLSEDPDEQIDLYDEAGYSNKRTELLERLVDVTTQPSRVSHYGNMPVHGGRKQYLGRPGVRTSLPFQMSEGPPVYPAPDVPALSPDR